MGLLVKLSVLKGSSDPEPQCDEIIRSICCWRAGAQSGFHYLIILEVFQEILQHKYCCTFFC